MTSSDALLVLVYATVLFLPGGLVTMAAGSRPWTAVASAPLVTYGLTVVTTQACTVLGQPFGPLPFFLVTLVGAAVAFALTRLTRFFPRRSGEAGSERGDGESATGRRNELIIAGGVLLGAVVSAMTARRAMGRLDAINQDWDASFHANATRFILDTGNADPAALAALYPQETFFYPNAWHALGAIVGRLSGASIPELLGSSNLLVGGIAGLGLAALIRAHGGRVAAAAAVPLLLASFSGFPIDVLWRGPLLPYAAGIALVPAFLLAFSDAVQTRRPAFVLVAALGAAGLLGLQPATALTAAVFAVFLVVARWIQRPARIGRDLMVAGAASLLTAVLAFTFVGGALLARSVAAGAPIDWPAVETPGQALGELLLLNHAAPFPQYWLALLVLAGLGGLARLRGLRWFVGGTAVFAALFVAAAAYDAPLVESVTLPWWNDRYRFVAIVTLGLAVLASHGLVLLASVAVRLVTRIPAVAARPRGLVFSVAVVSLLAVVGLGSGGFYVPYNAERMSGAFGPSAYVSEAEREAMAHLADIAGEPGERVMNDPRDGSVWMYALEGLRPVFGHVIDPGAATEDLSQDAQTLLASFSCLDTDEAVRDLVITHDIGYVFVGPGFLRFEFDRAPGLRRLDSADSLELIYIEDGVRIYEVDLAPLRPRSEADPACADRPS